mmetsp:Transcript_20972/g.39409  ORF Transcript_20972/g.39409 Transcript_20972/m.39409 type:complete len:303 (+) Transcript_20972:80-988(+)
MPRDRRGVSRSRSTSRRPRRRRRRDSRSRSSSRRSRRRGDALSPRMTFGRHAGMRYHEVVQQYPGYVHWARSQSNPSGGLRQFVSWLERTYGPDPRRPRSPDDDENEIPSEEDFSDPESPLGDDLEDDLGLADLDVFQLNIAQLMVQRMMGRQRQDGPFPSPHARHPAAARDAVRPPLASQGSSGRRGSLRVSQLLDELPRLTYSVSLFSGNPHPESCPICMEDFAAWEAGQDTEIVMTPCLHTFHIGCVRGWLKRRPECPTCRWDITDLGAEKAFDSSCGDAPQVPQRAPDDLEIVVSDDD